MRHESNRERVEAQLDAAIKKKVLDTARQFERIIDDEFTEEKHGEMYGSHKASAPGEAPAIWTAALRKGVDHVITHIGKMDWSVMIGVTLQSGRAEIAKFLEFGTSRMEPRPAWRTALAKLKQMLGG